MTDPTASPIDSRIRPMQVSEMDAVAALWYRAGKAAYPYLQGWRAMTRHLAQEVFRTQIAARDAVYVLEHDGAIVAYLALDGSYIDRLYVDPDSQRRGFGSALVAHAARLSPHGLELHTHQRNVAARAFYEGLGFTAVGFGTSPPPESAPDVEYHWRP